MTVPDTLASVMEIREIDDRELPRFVAVVRAAADERVTEEDFRDWKRQAPGTVWLLAEENGEALGAGRLTPGWHSPPGVGIADVRVPPQARGRGTGSALLAELQRLGEAAGAPSLEGYVSEEDGGSLAWAQRRGFREIGRRSTLVLELAEVAEPAVDPPAGVDIVSWAERPGLARGIYEVALEAYPDEPGSAETGVEPFETWLSQDMQGSSDLPEAVFVALAGGEVVGYAKLAVPADRRVVAHDMTGVKRAHRGRGIASALKRAEIAWAKRTGAERLETQNHELNAPIRALNDRYGYRVTPGAVTVRR